MTDVTPAGLTFVSNSGACVTPFPCALGTLPAGATRTIVATFRIAGFGAPASIINTATVTSATADPAPANNSATAVTATRRTLGCDLEGIGVNDVVTAAGQGGDPHVQAFTLSGGVPIELASFYAYDPTWCDGGGPFDPAVCDGVYVAGVDVTGDGLAEIITGTNRAGGPVRIFQVLAGGGVIELTNFFPYFELFRGPVHVAQLFEVVLTPSSGTAGGTVPFGSFGGTTPSSVRNSSPSITSRSRRR